jgi:hypothetical protein
LLVRNEHPIVTAKEAVRSIKIVISAVTCTLRARNYMLIFSSSMKHTNITVFLNRNKVMCMSLWCSKYVCSFPYAVKLKTNRIYFNVFKT